MSKIEKGIESSMVYLQIKELMENARKQISVKINNILVQTYWEIGKIIIEDEQENSERAEYGKKLLKELSKKLTKEYGKGFSKSNLFNMRKFYLKYQKFQTVSGKLSWSHYCEILSISDDKERAFYERECENSRWSVRELKRQISTSLYQRLLLSSGEINKKKVLELSKVGNVIQKPQDIIKDPYVFEFLGLPEDKSLLESDLENSLVKHIEKFLLELGKGFMFVGSQYRITLGNNHYYVDMVFYNKVLRSYVLIELKTSKLMPEAVGQMNMYLNYFKAEVNDKFDNEPVGIILCTDKENGIQSEYALGGLSNQIFASKYTLYIPNKEVLKNEVEKVLREYDKKIKLKRIENKKKR